jgi:hypothetical protein
MTWRTLQHRRLGCFTAELVPLAEWLELVWQPDGSDLWQR